MTTTDRTSAMITVIERLDDPSLRAALEALLEDAVGSGASIGYHAPLSPALNRQYWDGVAHLLAGEAHRLLVARGPDGAVLGSVQLSLCTKPNGAHRAEVQKLMVHRDHRGRGVARTLMSALEELARGLGRKLLVLDTLKGDFGEPFYERTGWTRAGEIPGYTIEKDGSYHPTVLFYRNI